MKISLGVSLLEFVCSSKSDGSAEGEAGESNHEGETNIILLSPSPLCQCLPIIQFLPAQPNSCKPNCTLAHGAEKISNITVNGAAQSLFTTEYSIMQHTKFKNRIFSVTILYRILAISHQTPSEKPTCNIK